MPIETVNQPANAFAFKGSRTKRVDKTDVCVKAGGIAELKGGKHRLKRVYGEGPIRGPGIYRVVGASVPGTELEWDNTGLKDKWQTNGAEAVLRYMGEAGPWTITNVDFLCRHWWNPDTKRWEFWKGWSALRDGVLITFNGGRAIGPWDIGEQGNATKPQTMKKIVVNGMALTHLPRVNRVSKRTPKRSGVGSITFKRCPKIKATFTKGTKGAKGKPPELVKVEPVLDSKGKPVYWPDTIWTPDK